MFSAAAAPSRAAAALDGPLRPRRRDVALQLTECREDGLLVAGRCGVLEKGAAHAGNVLGGLSACGNGRQLCGRASDDGEHEQQDESSSHGHSVAR
jgi:hypothetical protein